MSYLGDIRENNPYNEIGIEWGNINAVSKRYKWNGALLDLNNIEPDETKLYEYDYNYNDRKKESNVIAVSPLSSDNKITLTATKPVATELLAIVKYQYVNQYGNVDTNTIIIEFENGSTTATSNILFTNGTDFKINNITYSPETDDLYEYKTGETYIPDYSSLYYGVIRSVDIDNISAEMILESPYNFEIISNMKPGLNPLSFVLTTDLIDGLNEMEDDVLSEIKAEHSQTFVVVYDTDFSSISMTDALGMEDNTWEKVDNVLSIGENKYNIYIHRDNGDQVDIRDANASDGEPVVFSYNVLLK